MPIFCTILKTDEDVEIKIKKAIYSFPKYIPLTTTLEANPNLCDLNFIRAGKAI
jgi:hypothetical protein